MILLHPYAQRLRTGLPNAKTPPDAYWQALLAPLAQTHAIVQIATATEPALTEDVRRDLSMAAIADLVRACDFFLSVDSFLPHLAASLPPPTPRGVVLWSASDPTIFGYAHNLNLLRDRRYLRRNQFDVWEQQSYDPEAFLPVADVLQEIVTWQCAQIRRRPSAPDSYDHFPALAARR